MTLFFVLSSNLVVSSNCGRLPPPVNTFFVRVHVQVEVHACVCGFVSCAIPGKNPPRFTIRGACMETQRHIFPRTHPLRNTHRHTGESEHRWCWSGRQRVGDGTWTSQGLFALCYFKVYLMCSKCLLVMWMLHQFIICDLFSQKQHFADILPFYLFSNCL